MVKPRYFVHTVLAALTLTLVACGGGGDGDGPSGNQKSVIRYGGKFYAGPTVTGLQYDVGEGRRLTDSGGWYYYVKNKPITFYVGGIVIGRTTGREVITPLDLVGVNNPSDATVVNIARFLQTLDEDGDLTSGGITISEKVRSAAQSKSLNFTKSTLAFENDMNVQAVVAALSNRALIASADAEDTLRQGLTDRFTRSMATYTGKSSSSYTGCNNANFDHSSQLGGNLKFDQSFTLVTEGALVSGTASFSGEAQGVSIVEDLSFDNALLTFLGDISGPLITSVSAEGVLLVSYTSNFTGKLDGNNLTIQGAVLKNQDLGNGLTCDVSGNEISVEAYFSP